MSGLYKSPAGEAALKAAYAGFRQAWPVPREEVRVPTRLGETFAVASGDPKNPPLILLHGAGANATMWMGDVAAWSQDFRVYVVDIVGEPGESAPVRPPRVGDTYAEWLDEVLAGLSVARAAFVGNSLGGWHALDYAIRRPGKVTKLVLLAPGGLGAVRPGFLLQAAMLNLMGEAGRRRMLGSIGAGVAHPAVGKYLELIFSHFNPRRDALPRFSGAQLHTLKMPILMFVGGQDTLLDSAGSQRRLAHAAPQARIVMLPQAGHVLGGLTAPILEFLREPLP